MHASGTHEDERDEDDQGKDHVEEPERVPIQGFRHVHVGRGESQEGREGLHRERVVDLLIHGEELREWDPSEQNE